MQDLSCPWSFRARSSLLGIGTLIGGSGISFLPVWLAISTGAALGDWIPIGLAFTSGIPFAAVEGPHVVPICLRAARHSFVVGAR